MGGLFLLLIRGTMTVLIFANGDFDAGPWIQPYFQNAGVIIAADGGVKHLETLGRLPDLIIGDLDSADSELIVSLNRSGVRSINFPPDKDETDLELALIYSKQNFDSPIHVFGATGGRIDHYLANILLLAHPEFLELDISYIGRDYRLWSVHDRTSIVGEPGDVISLIPINGKASIAATSGLRWPLNNDILDFGPTRGVSNELIDERAEIEIDSGTIICIQIKNKSVPIE
ncbi:MAG: thiamine diphosphokinase [Anaerolineae bacterium]|nr:MAG: thiamine diphosphokinase [Anaerolineae bacterium]